MQWLLGASERRANEEKKNTTDIANWMAKASKEEGELVAKLTNTGAKLVAIGHEQWKKGQEADAVEDWYKRSIDWDGTSEGAQAVKMTLEEASKVDIDINQQAEKARRAGMEPSIANMIAGKSGVYQAKIAQLKLQDGVKGYEGWIRNQLLNNSETIFVPGVNNNIPFPINKTGGLADPNQRRIAHQYLRRQYFKEQGLSNFNEDFLNHIGYFKAIRDADAKMGSQWSKESDIAHSAQRRHILGKAMINDFSNLNVMSYISGVANGVDDKGNHIGYEKAWLDHFEPLVKSAMDAGDLDPKILENLAESQVPGKPEGVRYKDEWPQRFGPEGSLARMLTKARKDRGQRKLDETNNIGRDIQEEGVKELLESNYDPEVYLKYINRMNKEAPGFDTSRFDTIFENQSSDARNDLKRILEIKKAHRLGKLVDTTDDNAAVQSDPEVKAIIEAQDAIKKLPNYKYQSNAIARLAQKDSKKRGFPTDFVTGEATVNGELQDFFHQQVIKLRQLKKDGLYNDDPIAGAAQATKEYFELHSQKETDRYYYDTNLGKYPNLEKAVKTGRQDSYNKRAELDQYQTNQINLHGGGNTMKALESKTLWFEPTGDEKEANFVDYLTNNNGRFPPHVRVLAESTGLSQFDIANARQIAITGNPLDPQWDSRQGRLFKQTGVTSETAAKHRKNMNTTAEKINEHKHILKSLEQEGFSRDEAIGIILRDGLGPVGQDFYNTQYSTEEKVLGLSMFADFQSVYPEALNDVQEGAAEDLIELFITQTDPYNSLGAFGAQTYAALTGDYSVLLRPGWRERTQEQTEITGN